MKTLYRISSSAALIALLFGASCEPSPAPKQEEAPPVVSPDATSQTSEETTAPKTTVEATDAGKLLEVLDTTIASQQKRLETRPDQWLPHRSIAQAYMQRARLTHSWDDWDKAKEHVDKAFAIAPKGSGPFSTRASLKLSLHQFPEVDADLETASKALLLKNQDRAAILSRQAELAFQRGKLDDAKRLIEESYALHKDPTVDVQRGIMAFKLGEVEKARAHMKTAIAAIDKDDTLTYAWAVLMSGIIELDSGDAEAANAIFKRADEAFSGWYLIEEHLAETYTLLGQYDKARAIYESVVARVPTGEFMEALADTCEALKDTACAESQRKAAKKRYLEDIASHPQSAYGHGMDFFLQGNDGAKMLEIARANYELRPGHEPATKLAQALIRHNKLDEAKPLIESALKAGWSTADVHATAATLYSLQGKAELVSAQRELALKRHPDSMDDIMWLTPLP